MREYTTRSRSDAFDKALGENLRARRKQLGLRFAPVAAELGVSFQQLQKYERGANRLSAYLLAKLSVVLSSPVADLLPDLPPEDDPKQISRAAGRPKRNPASSE